MKYWNGKVNRINIIKDSRLNLLYVQSNISFKFQNNIESVRKLITRDGIK